jgi:hypothetical protein
MSTPSRQNASSYLNVFHHSTSASCIMKPPTLSARKFARLALVDRSGDLKPIRRPLPSDLLYSESEVSRLIFSCLTFCSLMNIGQVNDLWKAKCAFFPRLSLRFEFSFSRGRADIVRVKRGSLPLHLYLCILALSP